MSISRGMHKEDVVCVCVYGILPSPKKVSLTERDKYHMISLICGIYKNGTNELSYKTEIESQK